MADQDLAFAPALELARLVREKEVSPVELVELYAKRIDKLNPKLDAYLTQTIDLATHQAKRATELIGERELPPFHGVPVAIKDLNDTAGIRTTHGTAAFAERVPGHDEEVVSRIKRAGFIILGKTNTPEFGTTPWTEPDAYPPARNPWDTDRTPGGSSGGAAAAVAAGLCPVAQGSDGGGSIRIPAACCGLFGIKPSRGRVTAAPAPQSFLSQDGPITRSVADAAAMLDAMAGYHAGDAYWATPPERPFGSEPGRYPGRLRIAVTSSPPTDAQIAKSHKDAVKQTAKMLTNLGHEVEEAAPEWPTDLIDAFTKLWAVSRTVYEPAPPIAEFGPLNRALAEMGLQTSGPDYARAVGALQVAARNVVAFFDDYDVLVTPTLATQPPKVGEFKDPENPLHEFAMAAGFVPFTPIWNVTGQPAVSVPLHEDEDGLPLGIQIVGRPEDEPTLIRLSAQLEEHHGWEDRRPKVS